MNIRAKRTPSRRPSKAPRAILLARIPHAAPRASPTPRPARDLLPSDAIRTSLLADFNDAGHFDALDVQKVHGHKRTNHKGFCFDWFAFGRLGRCFAEMDFMIVWPTPTSRNGGSACATASRRRAFTAGCSSTEISSNLTKAP